MYSSRIAANGFLGHLFIFRRHITVKNKLIHGNPKEWHDRWSLGCIRDVPDSIPVSEANYPNGGVRDFRRYH